MNDELYADVARRARERHGVTKRRQRAPAAARRACRLPGLLEPRRQRAKHHRHGSYRERVGQLGAHVREVVGPRADARQHGGVGDRRAVVTENGSRQHPAHRRDQNRLIAARRVKQLECCLNDQRHQHAHRAPTCSRREGHKEGQRGPLKWQKNWEKGLTHLFEEEEWN